MRLTIMQPSATRHATQPGWAPCFGRVDRVLASPLVNRRATVCHAEVKKRKAFGEWLLEADDASELEQPEEKDFWEGAKFDIIGKTAGFAVPVLLVLLLLVGLFAANGYNSGATAVLQPATSPENSAKILQLEP